MRVLITNDDGIDAPGLAVLEEIAAGFATEVWTVAPATDQSGIGHALTLSNPLRIAERGTRRYSVTGTPADCVIAGITSIMDARPDLVLSGINEGQNIADDVVYSGTIGGAMEAAMMGVRSIAVSQAYRRDDDGARNTPWRNSRDALPDLLLSLAALELPEATFLNVNVPATEALGGVQACRQGRVEHSLETEERADGRGKPYHWLRFGRGTPAEQPGSDVAALRAGLVSVTPLQIDLTANGSMDALRTHLEKR